METDRDYISALPDEIILSILSFLPTPSTVRTSTLSQRWRHLWKFIPVINFPYPNQPESDTESESESNVFAGIDQCLSSHLAQEVRQFTVVAKVPYDSVQPNFGNWIDFAISRHVKSLEISLDIEDYYRETYFNLPKSFTNAGSLHHLALTGVDFRPRLGTFTSLKSLFLFESKLDDEGLQLIMSTCVVLESLSIVWCVGLINPKVSSMALKEFVFQRGVRNSNEISLQLDAPNLVSLQGFNLVWITQFSKSCLPLRVFLEGQSHPKEYCIEEFTHLIGHLSRMEFFGTTSCLVQFLDFALDFGGGPSTTLQNLKELYLSKMGFSSEYEVTIVLAFVRECPSLAKIQIKFGFELLAAMLRRFPPRDNLILESPYFKQNDFYPLIEEKRELLLKVGPIHQLKTVELFYYKGDKGDAELVKRILQLATSLEKMVLLFDDPGHGVMKDPCHRVFPLDVQEQLLEEVSLLPRASPHVDFLLG